MPAPPSGDVTAVVRLKHGEPELQRGAPEGQLASIDLPTYSAQLGYPLMTGAYGQLASETPAPAEMPVAFPKPSTDEGTHLSYSLQWFAFGVLMFVGFGYAARQQARNAAIDAEDQDEPELDGAVHSAVQAARRQPAPPRKRKKATAEEEEDALLDAQGY
ncbi:SURF1-like protein (fragment) [Arthrobacter sp. 8AJ]